jgi:hypothetical protein
MTAPIADTVGRSDEPGNDLRRSRPLDRDSRRYKYLFRLLPYTPEVPEQWRRIVTVYGISGKQTHDAQLV